MAAEGMAVHLGHELALAALDMAIARCRPAAGYSRIGSLSGIRQSFGIDLSWPRAEWQLWKPFE
jgi:hypothetical protein